MLNSAFPYDQTHLFLLASGCGKVNGCERATLLSSKARQKLIQLREDSLEREGIPSSQTSCGSF